MLSWICKPSNLLCRFIVRFMHKQYVLSYLQRSISKFQISNFINSQNINSPSGAICKVFGNFFLRLIRIMKFSPINTLHLFMFLRTNNSAVNINCNINLNGNTAGSFRMLSKISSYKLSENSPYVLAIVPSSRNTQWYLNNDIVIFSQLKKIEVDVLLVSYCFHMKQKSYMASFYTFSLQLLAMF